MRVLVALLVLCGAALGQVLSEDFDTYNRLVREWEAKEFNNFFVLERSKTDPALRAEIDNLGNRIREVKTRIDAARAKK